MNSIIKKPILLIVSAGLLFFINSYNSTAASITLTSPTDDVEVADGIDFATQVVGHEWSMDRLRDLALDYGFFQPNATGGIWTGRTKDSTAYVFPLSPGFVDATYVPYYYRFSQGTPFGPLNPLNANKYTRMSFRMAMPSSARSWFALAWSTNINVWPYGWNIMHLDGDWTFSSSSGYLVVRSPSTFRIHDIDLKKDDGGEEKNPSYTGTGWEYVFQGLAWTGTIYGLQFGPSVVNCPIGTDISLDWIRLYDPTTSPTVNLLWNTTGIPESSDITIQIFIDRDNQGYDGDLFEANMANDGDFRLRTAALPPGDYYFYLKAVRNENGGFTELATSAYSGRLRIGQSPRLEFTAPSFTSGVDFATAELGNPWDMSSSNDVGQTWEIIGAQFTGGVMEAVATAPIPPLTQADARMYLNLKKNGVAQTIPTAKYRYLTYTMKTDLAGNTPIMDRVRLGWNVHWTWWNVSLNADGTYSKELQLFEDWQSYTVDVWDNSIANTHPNHPWVKGWLNIPRVTTLRFDPIEPPWAVKFWIDDIKLCAMNAPSSNRTYTLQWVVNDSDSANVTVTFYYGYQGPLGYIEYATPITQIQQVPGTNSVVWDMAGIPNDEYYIRAVVTDGTFTNSVRSLVPVKVTGSFVRNNVKGMDPTVYTPASGLWNILYAGTNGATNVQWGFPGSVAAPGDYDGDGTNDCAVFYNVTGRWYIYSHAKATVLAWNFNWGWPGALTVPGDYDNDGKDDLAVMDENTGRWYIYSLAKNTVLAWNINWGWPGAKPVPGDYDGDGCADLAVLDRNIGNWFIYSIEKKRLGQYPVIIWNYNWGWRNCDFVPGDFDGDSVSDFAVFDRSTSNWFIYSLKRNLVLYWYKNWGFSGVTPVGGDYDDDGKSDLTVYNEPTGYWYVLFSGGGYDIFGPWGGSGAKPVIGNYWNP